MKVVTLSLPRLSAGSEHPPARPGRQNRRSQPRPAARPPVRVGDAVTGRLPSPAIKAVGPGTVEALSAEFGRHEFSSAFFGSALATGVVTKILCTKPDVVVIQRPSGKETIVLVTRIISRSAKEES